MKFFKYNKDTLLIKVPLNRFVSDEEDTQWFLDFLEGESKKGEFEEWLLTEYEDDLTDIDLDNIISERYDEILEALDLVEEEAQKREEEAEAEEKAREERAKSVDAMEDLDNIGIDDDFDMEAWEKDFKRREEMGCFDL